MDTHLQDLLNNLRSRAEQNAAEGRYLDAMLMSGAALALRAQRTRLEPPAPPAEEAPPEGAPGEAP